MKCLWNYAENIKRTTSTGQIGIYVKPANNQIIDKIIVFMDDISGHDTGGTSETEIHVTFLNFTVRKLFDGITDDNITLPNENYISNFKQLPFDRLRLHDGDFLTIMRDRFAVDGTLRIGIRAVLNIYARPTITYYNAQTIRHALYYDKLIGVIE